MTKDEYEGKDLDDALEAAASTLGVSEEELHYEIVEQGRKGVMGLGAKNARIRIMPPVGQDDETRGADKGAGRRRRKPRPQAEVESDAAPAEIGAGARAVEATVQRVLDLMGMDVQADCASDGDGGVSMKFKGPDRKMLAAKDGELASALQLLLNRMSRRSWPDIGRIDLGASDDGRRRRRDDDIVEAARDAAEQVAESGKTRKLQPMNAYERRLVHLTVREFSGLSSSSDGAGSLKRVRISKVQNAI